jgi:hypothetical protein
MKQMSIGVAILVLVAGAAACKSSTGGSGGGGAGGGGAGGGGGQAALAVGSACTTDAECGGGDFMCMTDHPDGYCIKMCDHANGDADCPTGSICQFDGTAAECHAECSAAADCRTGYTCAPASTDPMNFASHAFCDVAGP